MLRQAPFDKIGQTPTPKYTNANPTAGDPGSIPNAETFNQLQFEGENLVGLGGLTADGGNLFQWTQAVSRGGIWADQLTGTGDLAVATLPIPNNGAVLPALLRGMRVAGVATAANTVTNPKLRVMNLGSSAGLYADFTIIKQDGSALAAGDIVAGRIYRYEADGAGNVLISGGGLGATNPISNAMPIAQAAKSIFNVRQFQTSTRVSASGSVANSPTVVWSGITYTKKSPTSLVLCWGCFQTRINFNPQSSGGQYGAAQIALSLGGASQTFGIANSYPAFSYFNNFAQVFAGLAAGAQAVSVGLQRPDANAWTNVFNPISTEDSTFPAANTATLIFAEVEPT